MTTETGEPVYNIQRSGAVIGVSVLPEAESGVRTEGFDDFVERLCKPLYTPHMRSQEPFHLWVLFSAFVNRYFERLESDTGSIGAYLTLWRKANTMTALLQLMMGNSEGGFAWITRPILSSDQACDLL